MLAAVFIYLLSISFLLNLYKIGEAEIIENISSDQQDQLDISLRKSGLELMDDNKSMLIKKIKNIIVELVHYSDEQLKMNLSDYLSEKLELRLCIYLPTFFRKQRGTDNREIFYYSQNRASKIIVCI